MAMIVITEAQTQQVLGVKAALPVLKKAYEDCANGITYTGGRLVTKLCGTSNCGQWLTADNVAEHVFGSKFSATFPGNIKKSKPSVISQISIYSSEDGELLAIVEANYLTAVKTGGSAAIATDLMARRDASRFGVIGSGCQALSQVQAIQAVRTFDELRVYDRDATRVDSFVQKIQAVQNRPYKIIKCTSGDECVEGSDIVSTCTTSRTPVFNAGAIKPGTHINAIGSFTPFMQEIDDETIIRSACIITEHVEGLWIAAGDILIPFNKGLITKDKVSGSVGDVLTGKVRGRENDAEITLYESVGSCVLDLALALAVYKACKKEMQ